MKKTSLNIPWLIRMAWRDSRRSRPRLFLFTSSVMLGIAALVAVYSFGTNLQHDINAKAAELTGADLVISSNKAPSGETRKLLQRLGDKRSEQLSFVSMAWFPQSRDTRLVQVRALGGEYPYYGAIETTPAGASSGFRRSQMALTDKTLMLQYNLHRGDSLRVGELSFAVAGALDKAPGESGIFSGIAPTVYIPLRYAEKTGILKKGSRISYDFYYQYDRQDKLERQLKSVRSRLEKEGMDIETIASQKQNMGRSFENMTRFLSLTGFIALLLGCIGVASAIHVYVREKFASIAVLRCMGASAGQAFLIYLIQVVCAGLAGSVIGALLGTLIQQLLPVVLKDLLPLEVTTSISVPSVLQGITAGLLVSLLFAVMPLLSVRNISPLNTLRVAFEEAGARRDPLLWLVRLLIAFFITGFSYLQIHSLVRALWFSAGLLFAFLVLSGTAWALMRSVRRFFPVSWSFLWRQGLASLFRPNNQTLVMVVAVGLGTAFISTLLIVQSTLMKGVELSASGNQPNMVLFDIQTGQRNAVAAVAEKNGLPLIQQVPVVTMKIGEIKGRTAAEVRKDSSSGIPARAFNAEIRATFRDSLTSSEHVAEGEWKGHAGAGGPVYVSLEKNYAERLHVKVGDSMVFNVQGAPVPVVVGSLRDVDWNRIQTNFRVVFPAGILEDAPQFHVLVTRTPSPGASVAFQRQIVQRFPNISIIDLTLVLNVLDEILGKIGFVIRFMAAFSIITGLIVLVASIMTGRFQRIRESVLLRTLGGSRKQIFTIVFLEYLFLGVFAALTGIVLSLGAGWALAKFSFEMPLQVNLLPELFLFLSVCLLTVITGMLNSRDITSGSPLGILRKDL